MIDRASSSRMPLSRDVLAPSGAAAATLDLSSAPRRRRTPLTSALAALLVLPALAGCVQDIDGEELAGSLDDTFATNEDVAEAQDALVTSESYSDVGTLATGYKQACAIKTDSTVVCWGYLPTNNPAVSPSGTFSQIDTGYDGSCGVRTDGTLHCWGMTWNYFANPPSGTFSRVVVGYRHACALRTDGTVACWGDNGSGQLNAPSGKLLGISTNYNTSCGIKEDSTLVCWGYDGYYSFGLLNVPAGQFTQVSIGPWHACAIRATDSTVACWGMYGTAKSPSGTFTKISAGGGPGYDYDYTCGIRTDGSIACWSGGSSSFYTTLAGNWAHIAAGYGTCALGEDGIVNCFDNVYWPDPLANVPAGLVAKTHLDTPLPGVSVEVSATLGDWGYGDRRWWGDFDGDGKDDYCRAVGNGSGAGSYLSCALSTGTGLSGEYTVFAPLSNWGTAGTRFLVDFNGDGKVDYCRAIGSALTCSLSNGTTFSGDVAGTLGDWGYGDRRWMADFDGDGKADYCRAVGNGSGAGSYLGCSLSTGTGLSGEYTVMAPVADWGTAGTRFLVDFNGDGKADYCRAIGNTLTCSLSNGAGFSGDVTATVSDWGYSDRRWMVDRNGDGKADYCRAVDGAGGPGSTLECLLSTGTGLSGQTSSPVADWGPSDRRWMVDFSGSGRASYARGSSSSGSTLLVTVY